jgi:hypothetical protein
MQGKFTEFLTATAMAKTSNRMGMNPKKYKKQAKSLQKDLIRMQYPYMDIVNSRMDDIT